MFDDNAKRILNERILLKDENNKPKETPEEMIKRVAKAISTAADTDDYIYDGMQLENINENKKQLYKDAYDLLSNLYFMPNSPTLVNAGKDKKMNLAACFVLGIPNDLQGILDTLKTTALIHQSGGGTGFNFSNINLSKLEKKPVYLVYKNKIYNIQINEFTNLNENALPMQKDMSDDNIYFVEDNMKSLFTFNVLLNILLGNSKIKYINFDNVRPKGSVVSSTGGVASGPESFMKVWYAVYDFLTNHITPITTLRLFNASTEEVKQGGTRRGANMGVLNINNQYIEDWIVCKQKYKIPNFNISVAITHRFMNCYKNNDYNFVLDNGKPINATTLFNAIVNNAHKNGDPGILFIDRINQLHPLEELIESTNPCVTGDTLILTKEGYKPIIECIGKTLDIWNGHEWSSVTPRQTGTDQELLKIEFSDGSELKCTPYHRFALTNKECEAKDLIIGDSISKFSFPIIEGKKSIESKLAYTKGLYAGDGSLHTKSNTHSLWLYGKKKELLKYCIYDYSNECDRDRIHVKLPDNIDWNKEWVPDCNYTIQTRLDYLAGLIDTDGSLNNKVGAISISSINKIFLKSIQYILHTLGCKSILINEKPGGLRLMPDGKGGQKEYKCNASFRIVINTYYVTKLIKLGLHTKRVPMIANNKVDKSHDIKIINITKLKTKENVYCFTDYKNNTGIFNGIYCKNCGEQVLLNEEACNLGSINLLKHLKIISVGKYEIDYTLLEDTIRKSVRFLDAIISINQYATDQINNKTKLYRKIGLGVMGWADILIKMQTPYESEEAISLAKKLSKFINDIAWNESEQLAIDYGNYPGFDNNSNTNKKFNMLRRNATLTTIAPTGTISAIAGVSSGIEPLFALSFTKNIMDGQKLQTISNVAIETYKDILYNSEDELPPLKQFKNHILDNGTINGFSVPDKYKEILNIFKTAQDISVEGHIKMQAAWQENVDNAVSKTINMKSSATVEDVKKAYLLADKLGCKGITIYRDGSIQNQVLTTNKKKSEISVNSNASTEIVKLTIQKRHKILPGFTVKVPIGCGVLYITITFTKDAAFEVFIVNGKGGGCKASNTAIGILSSHMLRYNIPHDDIIQAIGRIPCDSCRVREDVEVMSCPDAIARTLSYCMKLLKDGYVDTRILSHPDNQLMSLNPTTNIIKPKQKEKKQNICPECGQSTFVPESGCMTCMNCGFSKCG